MRDLDLPRRHALMGVPVIVMAGFESRGKPTYTPKGGLEHHTAGPKGGVAPSLGTVTNGRPDLAGPLCNTLQDRNDVAVEVASGRANHGGAGHWRGITGNSNLFGCETEFSGTTAEAFSEHRFDTACRIQAGAALGRYDASLVALHLEYAEPHGRKIDLLAAAIAAYGGADGMRARVQHYIDHPPGLAPVVTKPAPLPKLTATLHLGSHDAPGDEHGIVRHVENLLLWNANKRGHPAQNPGKLDGVFTGRHGTAESVVYFRRWLFDLQHALGATHPVFKAREFEGVDKGDYSNVAVGPKTLAALEWAAAA